MNIDTTNTTIPGAGAGASDAYASSQAPVKSNVVINPEKVQASAVKESSSEKTQEMADALNDIMNDLGTNLGFSIREDMDNKVVVEVKNRNTDELIRQIPSEELLKIMEKMEALSGIIFDGKV